MKKFTKLLYLNIALFMLVGCASNKKEESATSSSGDAPVLESTEEDATETDASTSASELEETDANDISSEESVNNGSKNGKETLSQYSSEQIEYARIWLQLGANQDIDGLYIKHIPADTSLNPDDETSANYPEDVIQLAGSRLVDGSVTYSGNGDGTINIYNVPLRWDGNYPAGEKFYKEIIENAEKVYVQPGDDKQIIELIKLLNVHQ